MLTEDGDSAKKDVDNAEEVMPHGVDWREGVPVRVDHMFDVVRHQVSHRHSLRVTKVHP